MEENVNYETNLGAKLNQIRLALSTELEKSGQNNYSHFSYFQLKDFMPRVIELCNEVGVFTKFQMERRKVMLPTKKTTQYITNQETGELEGKIETEEENFNYALMGVLYVTDLETGYIEEYVKEAKEATVAGATPIQNIGATSSYMKRYMYMDLFEINEADQVDGADNSKLGNVETQVPSKPKKVTKPKVNVVTPEPPLMAMEQPTSLSTMDGTWTTNDVKVEQEPVVETPTPVVETPVANTEEIMSISTKTQIANYARGKGLDPRTVIIEVAKRLNTDVPLLKENQKDAVFKIIDSMV